MTINNKFNLEQLVFLKTDPEQLERMVTAITIRGKNLMYELTYSDEGSSYHQECEINETIDQHKKLSL